MTEKYKDHIKVEGNSQLFDEKYGFKDIDYSNLIELYKDDDYIPYAQYLRTNLWKTKRLEILDRDNFLCQKCGAYNTVSRQNKTGEIVLEWSDVVAIFWTDTSGQERVSSLSRPQGLPQKPYNLQVHHKKYIVNRLPWNYDNEDLVTLCNYCHTEEHNHNHISIYDEYGKLIVDHPDCSRCGGTGYMPEYRHVQNGICFKCGGTGFDVQLVNKKLG
jgi:5-methylcytosine-specific restriction endonuclease McrA/ribosomal protein S27AE